MKLAKLRAMAFHRISLLVLFALVFGAGQVVASEQRDYAAAEAAFQDSMWNRAETEFADFIKKYPASAQISEARLMQAQAEFEQGKYSQSIALLQTNEASAGNLGDAYVFWVGSAQFTNSDYSASAETFAHLVSTYPGSTYSLDGVINEAAARAKLGQWEQVDKLLQGSRIFQDAARTNAMDKRVLRGRLLLARTFLAENHPDSAVAVLQSAEEFKSRPDLDWQRLYLLCQAHLADGNTNQALALTTNLMNAAVLANNPVLSAQSVAEQARILEANGKLSDAVLAYQQNLAANVPEEWQRLAIMKIAELSAAQTDFPAAENALQNFQSRFANSPAMDSVVLALGELHLKNYVVQRTTARNDLLQAQTYFNQFIDTYTNSPLLGRAFLGRGWCFWHEKNWTDAAADFQSATEKLPPSVEQAVAYFKLADAQFRENDLNDAYKNYQVVVENFTNFPAVDEALGAEALYQMLRVAVQKRDLPAADAAVARILKIYPQSGAAETGTLIDGEARSDFGQPAKAREQFRQFELTFTNSQQLPLVELDIAKSYQLENDWPMAISNYDSWIEKFKDQPRLLPSVEYARAWANFQGGRTTNAFLLFTNFLAEFPSNADLTPVAQWWVADYYADQGDWTKAEKNYALVFQNWPDSTLAYPAMYMAGRAAMGWQGYDDAKSYFTGIIGITNVPPQYAKNPGDWYSLSARAWFDYGDVFMQQPSTDTNNPYANYIKAIGYFQLGVCTLYPGSQQAALAWGEIGDCYYQLAGQAPQYYTNAADAYGQVIGSDSAGVADRSQAQVGLGMVFEKRAALDAANQTAFLQSALNNYLDVFFGKNLRDGEMASPFWVLQAGQRALPLMDTLGIGDVNKFVDKMEILLPQDKDALEKKRLELIHSKNPEARTIDLQ
jgi:TolA-binding protein